MTRARQKVPARREQSAALRLADLARRQHGVVARRQLLAIGFSASAIGRRVQMGGLHRVHAGVYAVGHPHVSRDGRWIAAVLACGPGAALGYATAAFEWSMRRGEPRLIRVVVPHATKRTRAALVLHRHPGDPPPSGPHARRGDDRARHPGHHARAHDPRLRRGRDRPGARVRARPGGDPAADRLPRPRCPRKSPPEAPRIRAAQARAGRLRSGHEPHAQRPRAGVPRAANATACRVRWSTSRSTA
jgi:Transcriptional regulator, AbiEi antitoxin